MCVAIDTRADGAGEASASGQGVVVSPRSLSSSTAPIAQSLKGLFQRQSQPPVPVPSGGVLSSRRTSSEAQSPTPGMPMSSVWWQYLCMSNVWEHCLGSVVGSVVLACYTGALVDDVLKG